MLFVLVYRIIKEEQRYPSLAQETDLHRKHGEQVVVFEIGRGITLRSEEEKT